MFTGVLFASCFLQLLLQSPAFADNERSSNHTLLNNEDDPNWGDYVYNKALEWRDRGDKLLLREVIITPVKDVEFEWNWMQLVKGNVTQVLALNIGRQRGRANAIWVRPQYINALQIGSIVHIRFSIKPDYDIRMMVDVYGVDL